MDIKGTTKKVVEFVSSVQEACDAYRKCMEELWLLEYNTYISEWKQKQIDQRKQLEKKALENRIVQNENLKELEEIALADSLLRKARNIRLKSQKTMNGVINCQNILPSSPATNVFIQKTSPYSSERLKSKRQMHQSKSDNVILRHKNPVVPRSKSASAHLIAKEDGRPYLRKSSTVPAKNNSNTNRVKPPDQTSEDSNVISSKDLDELKKLRISLTTCQEIRPSEKAVTSSDSHENSHPNPILPQPSSREFIEHMKGKIIPASSHFSLKLWYPFLSAKSEMCMTSFTCSDQSHLNKISAILYVIQETMMWIDLLHLVEKEVYPSLVFDLKDSNKLRICKYIQSLFNPNGQRIPMFDPNS